MAQFIVKNNNTEFYTAAMGFIDKDAALNYMAFHDPDRTRLELVTIPDN